jgi:hypothetical protein
MAEALNFKPYERNVQQGMVDGQYASGAFTMIAAGPPRLQNIPNIGTAADVVTPAITQPIGMVQQFSLSHQRAFSRVFELGSERSYFISGRTNGQISLSRVYYHGPSLLRMLYAAKSDLATPVTVLPFTTLAGVASAADPNPHNVKIRPGFSIKTVDSNEQTIGAVYAEGCYVPSHSFSVDANGLMVQENVSIQFERIVPVAVNAVNLIQAGAEGLFNRAQVATSTGEA